MRILRPLTIGALLALAQLTAFGAELAVLRNGFTVRFERKEQTGNVTRLYTGTGYMEIATEQIASFEAEEAPVAPPEGAPAVVLPAATATAAPVSAPRAQTAGPAQTVAKVDLDQVIR